MTKSMEDGTGLDVGWNSRINLLDDVLEERLSDVKQFEGLRTTLDVLDVTWFRG